MHSRPASHLLTFLMPRGATPAAGGASDSPCIVDIGKIGLISIMGPSREAVFDEAARILAEACAGLAPLAVTARLYTLPPQVKNDGRDWLNVASGIGGVDTWSIIVGAGVAFSPTSLDPHFPNLKQEVRPAIAAVKR